ncbi:MAG: glutaminyl-peptide cyclotransferase [Legionellales bacterium]|nr:glutaminyl-peptide cyclotransferase [Legionellales bacterium]
MRFSFKQGFVIIFLLLLGVSLGHPFLFSQLTLPSPPSELNQVPQLRYQVIKTFPLQPHYYIEGLIYSDSSLLLSSGLLGQSCLSRYDLAEQKIAQSIQLPNTIFAEGITELNHKIYQLTYQSNIVYVYDAKTLQLQTQFTLPFQGWGLTSDGQSLILSNGTSALIYVNPKTHALEKYRLVTLANKPVINLNELDYVKGLVYANIFQSGVIVAIDPESGVVQQWLDITALWREELHRYPKAEVPNGIAYDPHSQHFYISGKFWPELLELQVVRER